MKTIIITGTRHGYTLYLRSNGLSSSEYIYISHPQQLMSYDIKTPVLLVGNWDTTPCAYSPALFRMQNVKYAGAEEAFDVGMAAVTEMMLKGRNKNGM